MMKFPLWREDWWSSRSSATATEAGGQKRREEGRKKEEVREKDVSDMRNDKDSKFMSHLPMILSINSVILKPTVYKV